MDAMRVENLLAADLGREVNILSRRGSTTFVISRSSAT